MRLECNRSCRTSLCRNTMTYVPMMWLCDACAAVSRQQRVVDLVISPNFFWFLVSEQGRCGLWH